MSNLGKLLAWGIENSNPDANPDAPKTQLNPTLLAELFGQKQKSDAELMKEALAAVQDPSVPLEDKEIAFDNFELLIEHLDNANNIENLSLWPPLISLLEADHAAIRKMAAWCIGTAVQNNVLSQKAFMKHDGIPKLVNVALKDPVEDVRKKAVFALSSQVRNHDVALEKMLEHLPEELVPQKIHHEDMESIDELMRALRERVAKVISQ